MSLNWVDKTDNIDVISAQDINAVAHAVEDLEQGSSGTAYCTCSTDKNTPDKEATVVSGSFELKTGAAVDVKFTNANFAENPTLNIASTGAKPIKLYSGTLYGPTPRIWQNGETVRFVYDGTNWDATGKAAAGTGYLGTVRTTNSPNADHDPYMVPTSSAAAKLDDRITLLADFIDEMYILPEAPRDGKIYGRKNGTWVVIE